MNRTLGQKIATGFGVVLLFTLIISGVAVYALRTVVTNKDLVLTVNAQNAAGAQAVLIEIQSRALSFNRFLLSGDKAYLEQSSKGRTSFLEGLSRLERTSPDSRTLLQRIRSNEELYNKGLEAEAETRKGATTLTQEDVRRFQAQVVPRFQALQQDVETLLADESVRLAEAKRVSSEIASSAVGLVLGMLAVTFLLAVVFAVLLSRGLTREIGSAVTHIQSASAELQMASNQQATSSKEQGTAVNQVSTTIKELLVTARQISESAQRVAQIASETTTAARAGDQTVSRARDSVANVQRQIDVLVTHMLDLGKKSQQIGGILEIINELAEQTNILSINATIEAAGAGEAGQRFGAVAEEIRKLADRVGSSTREIRQLIDEIRGAVNTTVMVTEGGAKAVEAGTRQFGDVTMALKHIVDLVATTSEASREIELSTKQQTSAVEQVNTAMAHVLQAARETEASASQTLQTSTQLATLSMGLSRLIQPVSGS